MRSSSSAKRVKNVSETYPEHGLPKKENDGTVYEMMEEDDVQQKVYSMATKVVQDVVKLASETAKDKRIVGSSAPIEHNSHQENSNRPAQISLANKNLERVPTILIDTVPSEPSSPPEWPPPRPEDIIEEEEEAVDEADIDLCFEKEDSDSTGEVKSFASSYVEDILSKAVEIAEERRKLEDEKEARVVATRLVEEVISRANETAMGKLTSGLKFPSDVYSDVPSIQIDTIASMPPSPEDDLESHNLPVPSEDDVVQPKQEPAKKLIIPEIFCFPCDDEPEEQIKTEKPNLLKFSDAPEDVRNFAASYVKDIVARAITMAEEKLVSSVPFHFDVNFMKVNGPWYIRAREAIMRILRLACFCTPRRTDT